MLALPIPTLQFPPGQKDNDGTITEATWKDEEECASGKCLRFDGSSDYVEIEDFDF